MTLLLLCVFLAFNAGFIGACVMAAAGRER